MTEDEVYTATVNWIHTLTGLTTIRAHEGAERPPLPYVMVNMVGFEPLNWDRGSQYVETGNTTPEGKAEITQAPVFEYEWTFSVHAFGENQSNVFTKLQSALWSQAAHEGLEPLVVHSISPVRRIPEMVNAEWEYRSNADVAIRGLVSNGFIVETIETITPTEFNQ